MTSSVGKKYVLPDIQIQYMDYREEYLSLILETLGCTEITYTEESFYQDGRKVEVNFNNSTADIIHVLCYRNSAVINLFSDEPDIYRRYIRRINNIISTIKANCQGQLWISMYCNFSERDAFLTVNVAMPGNYEQAIPLMNYSSQTRVQLARLEETIETGNFFGRIILLKGPPGTGKSYYIKRLISKMHQDKKVEGFRYFLGSGINMLELTDCLDANLLIFEDADHVLGSKYERKEYVAKLLNFSSGFIETKGLFVFSSNLDTPEIDPAFIRDGRLLAHIEFDLFSKTEGESWLRDRGCEAVLENKDYSLANLYAVLNEFSKIEQIDSMTKIGFRAG